MTHRFTFTPGIAETEFQITGPRGPLPVDAWSAEAPDHLLPGIDLLRRLEAAEAAIAGADVMLVENATVAALAARDAAALGLPPLATAAARVRLRGVLARPGAGADLDWVRPTGQPIVGVSRTGAFLRIGDDWFRVADALFAVAEAVDRLNAAGDDDGERFAAASMLQEALPAAIESGAADAAGLASTMTIAVADAVSLDLTDDGEDARLVPILHRSGGNPDDRLLTDEAQQAFGSRHFNAYGTARPVYAIGGGTYVVLSPPLRRVLDVVRATQSKSLTAKKALLASPRAAIRQAIGEDVDDTVLETLIRETAAYAERVLGLGLWQKRVLPWIALEAMDWIGTGEAGDRGTAERPDRRGGLMVGDRRIELEPEEIERLRGEIEAAIGAGVDFVRIPTDADETVDIPATIETLGALEKLAARQRRRRDGEGEPDPDFPDVLMIRPNEDAIEVEGAFTPRQAPTGRRPSCLSTRLKIHQEEGLDWLCGAYATGRPGVLLADDMGLGKTLQGLAFLAWLREAMSAGTIRRGPVAIVAPTGLLQNWKAEEARHLARPALGTCLELFGKGLAALKRLDETGRPALDTKAIASADWVLTTYETLRDYDKDFGAVRFAAMLFDEAQKIKTPGTRMTDAAKAMNVDFRVALTGTPVENRLADLWCITDAVHPAVLGDLKTFSATYERAPDAESLGRLKRSLDVSYPGRPALLLRRLKKDRLPDLAAPTERPVEMAMTGQQQEAYQAALDAAKAGRGEPGAMLKALQALRSISLHPDPEMAGSDDDFIAASARCRLAFASLDEIAGKHEKALIFVDDLALQARLAGVIQRRYRLKAAPMIINGSVSGQARQGRVDRFQAGGSGFDVMILSPRAGGVGLTLTAANHAIHLSRWWNPAVEDQCTGRVLRIGQSRPVVVHLPLAILSGARSSFDLNLDALIRRKRQLFQDAFMPPEATADECDELFRRTVE